MRVVARRARRVLNEGTTRVWELVFAAAGGLRRPPAEPWTPAGGPVLVVAPHPDDEVAGCGGTILRHRAAGDAVVVAYLSDGRRSRALGLGPEAMARERRHEAEAAAAILDVEPRWLGLPEGEWRHEEGVAALVEVLRDVRPAVVYAPSRIDFHPEHRRAAAALATALENSALETVAPENSALETVAPETAAPQTATPETVAPETAAPETAPPENSALETVAPETATAATADAATSVRVYPVQVPLTPAVIDLVCPVDDHADALVAALEAHRSQVGSLRRCLRARRYAARLYRRGGLAETFWRLDADAYRRLHPPASVAGDAPFRGLRFDAFSDPLAYLAGAGARRRLAAEARR